MVPQEFLGIGGPELMLLIVLAVIFFGPEKLPEISRKAAKVVHMVRLFANSATAQLREELGPEYKDLKLSDLNPKTLVQKTLLKDIEGDLDEIRKDLDGVKGELTGSLSDMNKATSDVKSVVKEKLPATAPAVAAGAAAATVANSQTGQSGATASKALEVPWDTEAT